VFGNGRLSRWKFARSANSRARGGKMFQGDSWCHSIYIRQIHGSTDSANVSTSMFNHALLDFIPWTDTKHVCRMNHSQNMSKHGLYTLINSSTRIYMSIWMVETCWNAYVSGQHGWAPRKEPVARRGLASGLRGSGFSEILVASRGGCCIPFWAAFDPHLWSFLSIPDALAFIVHKNNFCHIQAFVPFNSRISIPRACFIGKQIWAFSLVCFAEPTDFVFLGRTNWGPLANEPAAIGLCEASWVSVNLEGMGMDEHYWRNLTLFCLNTRMFFLWARESTETAGFLKQPPSGGLDQQFWPTSRFNTNWAQLSLWNAQPTTGNLITSV